MVVEVYLRPTTILTGWELKHLPDFPLSTLLFSTESLEISREFLLPLSHVLFESFFSNLLCLSGLYSFKQKFQVSEPVMIASPKDFSLKALLPAGFDQEFSQIQAYKAYTHVPIFISRPPLETAGIHN